MDMEKGMGPIMGVRYGVSVIPTFLFLTSDGTLVYSISGYQGEEELISAAQVALNPGRKETAWNKRYDEGDRKGDFLLNYVYHKFESQDPLYPQLVNDYLETQKDWGTEDNVKFIFNFLENTDSPMFEYMAANRANFYKSFGEEKITKTIDVLVNNKMYNTTPPPSLDEIGILLKKAYPEDGAKRFLDIRLARFLKEGKHREYALAVMEYLELNPSSDSKELIAYANYFNTNVEDQKLLKQAIDWTEKGITKNASMDNYRLLTDLYSKTGERKRAIKACKKGIKLAKKTKQDSTFLKALLKSVKSKK
jgi:tetratricopeptide (TPR) repeat protein